MVVNRKRKVVEEEEEVCEYPSKPTKKKSSPIKLTYTIEHLKEQQEEIKECTTIKKYNLLSENINENNFPKTDFFINNIFSELQNENIKESFNMINFNYILNFITLNSGTSSFKINEIEIKPILIKTHIRFFIIHNDDEDINNIAKNFLEKNNSKNNILYDEIIELRNDPNYPLTRHLININWHINENWNKEKLNEYYWGYQIVKHSPFFDLNFGIKELEEKIIKYNDGTNNDLKTEVQSQIIKIKDQLEEQIMSFLKNTELCEKINECQKK